MLETEGECFSPNPLILQAVPTSLLLATALSRAPCNALPLV